MDFLYSIAQIQGIERAALENLPERELMKRAGLAASNLILDELLQNKQNAKVLILAGPGNNGGDAFEVANNLSKNGIKTYVISLAGKNQPKDAKGAFELAQKSSAKFRDAKIIDEKKWTLIIDGLFGIGLARPIEKEAKTLIEKVNSLNVPILALDVPSGLNAGTGEIVGGENGTAIRADRTITFIGAKPGLFTRQGKDCAGKVHVNTLNIDTKYFPQTGCRLNSPALFRAFFKKRPHDSHKGSYGDVAILGGAKGMGGAIILAAKSALYGGTGRVYAVFLNDPPNYDPTQPEIMCRDANDFDFSSKIIVAGPGLGQTRQAYDALAKVLGTKSALVLDADALNMIAGESGLQKRVINRRAPTLITPHPLEAARITGTTTKEIQSDRIKAAKETAEKLNAYAILKGSGSVIATPDGQTFINTTGNPALATAGTGDVLAGLCGSLLAQKIPPLETALAATWIHGHAADNFAEKNPCVIGFTASELLREIRRETNLITKIQKRVTNIPKGM